MRIVDLVREKAPKINANIARGYVVNELANGEEYILSVLKSASASFPPEIEFVGISPVSTKEAVEVLMNQTRAGRNGGNKLAYEYKRSDIYLIKILFRFKGELVEPVYIGLPFVRDGGLMKINGATYSVVPQLADIAISVTASEIYCPLTRDKLKFFRLTHSFRFNGLTTIGYCVYSNLYRDSKRKLTKSAKTVNMQTGLIHYLLSKYGLNNTFDKLGLSNYVYGFDDEAKESYYTKGWNVFEASGTLPKGSDNNLVPTKLWFAFPKDNFNEPIVRDTMASIYYILDHFPDRMTEIELDNPDRWLLLLAHAIFANGEKEAKLLELVSNHVNSISYYVDAKSKEWLAMGGLSEVNDIYDLMINMVLTYSRRKLDAEKNSTSMYGKHLLVKRRIYSDIVSHIFYLVYSIQQKKRNRGDAFSKQDLEIELKKHLNTRLILRLNRADHPEVEPVSCPGAYMPYRVTTRVVLQSSNAKSKKSAKVVFDSFLMGLDVSIAECGTMLAPSKSEMTGRGQLNVFTEVEPSTGKLIQKEHLKYITVPTQEMLK